MDTSQTNGQRRYRTLTETRALAAALSPAPTLVPRDFFRGLAIGLAIVGGPWIALALLIIGLGA